MRDATAKCLALPLPVTRRALRPHAHDSHVHVLLCPQGAHTACFVPLPSRESAANNHKEGHNELQPSFLRPAISGVRSDSCGTARCIVLVSDLSPSPPSTELRRQPRLIRLMIGSEKDVSHCGLVTLPDECSMRPMPTGKVPHRIPISSNRAPDSMGPDAHRTPPPMGILADADDHRR